MSQKTMIAMAASLTAFVLVIVGGLFARVSGSAAAASDSASVSSSVLDLWSQREAAYRKLIDQANARLLAAERPTTSGAASGASQGFVASISPAEAATRALAAAPGARLTAQPGLVSFQGVPAYEVLTTLGKVYINATTGSVLYNGAAQQVVASTFHGESDSDGDDND